MTVRKFVQPDMTTQNAAAYKAAIEAAIAVMAQVGAMFAASEKSPVPDMTVQIGSGETGIGGSVAAASIGPIGAPAANPRIDRIYFNPNGLAFGRQVGVEAVTPVAPAAPYGTFLICDVALHVGQTQITNNDITDLRSPLFSGPIFADGGFVNVVDPDGLFRLFVGRSIAAGGTGTLRWKLHNNNGTTKYIISNSDDVEGFSARDDGITQQRTRTFAQLPAAAAGLTGASAYISDSNTVVYNAIAAGGGANKVRVQCDGTNWRVG
jgi:hypothetical protein